MDATEKDPSVTDIKERQAPRDWSTDHTILVVDDNEDNVYLLKSLITSRGYKALTAGGGQEAIEMLSARKSTIDLVLLDVMMPLVSGLDVTRFIRRNRRINNVPVILLTAKQLSRDEVARCFDAGADDFLIKPIDSVELLARVRSALRTKKLQDEVTMMNERLELLVEERAIEIMLTRDAAIFGFAKLAEYRDPDTGGHLERIRNYVKALAHELSESPRFEKEIDDEFIITIYQSCILHDIGKVGIPDAILLKPGKLSPGEFTTMKMHATIGGDALASSGRMLGEDSFLTMGKDIAYYHHEKWDGSGYPKGLAGYQIPLPARIMALADVYDALVSKRIYKEAMSQEQARAIIVEGSAKHFDPDIVQAFLNIEDEFIQIKNKYIKD